MVSRDSYWFTLVFSVWKNKEPNQRGKISNIAVSLTNLDQSKQSKGGENSLSLKVRIILTCVFLLFPCWASQTRFPSIHPSIHPKRCISCYIFKSFNNVVPVWMAKKMKHKAVHSPYDEDISVTWTQVDPSILTAHCLFTGRHLSSDTLGFFCKIHSNQY